jgi:hypothetical protein
MPTFSHRPSIRSISSQARKIIEGYRLRFEADSQESDLVPVINAGGRTHLDMDKEGDFPRNDSPPSLGFSGRNELDPSLIENMDGVEIVFYFFDEERELMKDKVLDYNSGKFCYV